MKTIAAAIFVSVMLLCRSTALAQDANAQPASASAAVSDNLPDSAPAKPPSLKPVAKPRAAPLPHKFLDARNAFAAGSFAVGLAGDSWSTQRALSYPGTREANPLARPFVASRAGEAVYSGSSLAFLMGGMYLAHKTNHHKLERVVPWALAGWEGFLTGWNIHQISRVR